MIIPGPAIHESRGPQAIIRFVVFAAIAMAAIDGIVVSIALPTISRSFAADVAHSQWIITAYLITETSLLLIFGRLSEYTGKRTLFLAGLILFTASSLACGLAMSLWELIAYRVFQACGSAMIFSISWAILFEIASPEDQGRTMGYIGAVTAAAGIAAPILGGFLTEALGWEYIFLINVPIGIVGAILFARYFSRKEQVGQEVVMDWPGSATMVISLIFIILFLFELSSSLTWSWTAALFLLISATSAFLFLIAESRSTHPLLDLTIFRNPGFSLPNSATVCFYMALFMVNLLAPFYFEEVMGITPSRVGMIFLIAPAVMIIAAPVSGWLYDQKFSRALPVLGILLTGISLVLLGYAARAQDLYAIIFLFVPLFVGAALFHSPSSTDIMRALPLERAGLASSVSATIRNLGMTLGVCVSGILLTLYLQAAGYSGPVQDAVPGMLAGAVSAILIIAAALCGVGAILYVLKNHLVK